MERPKQEDLRSFRLLHLGLKQGKMALKFTTDDGRPVGRSTYAHWENSDEDQQMPERYIRQLAELGFYDWLAKRELTAAEASTRTSARDKESAVVREDLAPYTEPKRQAPMTTGPDVTYNFRNPNLGDPAIPVSYPMVAMRYAGEVPASGEWGDPLASETFVEMEAKFDHPKRYCTRIRGNSCYPALRQGDMAIWHANPAPPEGQIVLAQNSEHQPTVKELGWDSERNRPVLIPINPEEKAPPDGEGWEVVAQLVGVIRVDRGVERTWYVKGGLTAEMMES
jgi:SOS-response transcriptional repressor LexA